MKNLTLISLFTLTSLSIFGGDMGHQDETKNGRKSPMEMELAAVVNFGDDDGVELGTAGLTPEEIALIEQRLKEQAKGPGVEEGSLKRIAAARAQNTLHLVEMGKLTAEQEAALKAYLKSGEKETGN
ncbi:hypothetical protein HOM50_05190 [bacterium]|nr:hypothetical protein [bacterium]MBT5015776.1 hypothetical protein [bacterium]